MVQNQHQDSEVSITSDIFYNISLLIEQMNYQLYDNALKDLLIENRTTKGKFRLRGSFNSIINLLNTPVIKKLYDTDQIIPDKDFINNFKQLKFAVTYIYFTVNKVVDMISKRIMKHNNINLENYKSKNQKKSLNAEDFQMLGIDSLDFDLIDKIKKFVTDWNHNFEAIKKNYDEQNSTDFINNPVAINLKNDNISNLRPYMKNLNEMTLNFFRESISVVPGRGHVKIENINNLNFVIAILCLKYFDRSRDIAIKTPHEVSIEKLSTENNKQGGWWSKINEELTSELKTEMLKKSKKIIRPNTAARPTTAERPTTANIYTPISRKSKRVGGNKNSLYNVIMRRTLKNKTM